MCIYLPFCILYHYSYRRCCNENALGAQASRLQFHGHWNISVSQFAAANIQKVFYPPYFTNFNFLSEKL